MEKIIYSIPLTEFTDIIRKCIRDEMSSVKPDSKEDALIKIEDAVILLRVSKVTLYKWRTKGILPYYRIASRIYFKKSELLDALKSSIKSKGRRNCN